MKAPKHNLRWGTLLYFLVPVLLAYAQYKVTAASLGYIRYEDLAESIRNPFWLYFRQIYDGTSSNVGWYGTLFMLYSTFGFHLYTARFVRYGMYALAIFVYAGLLRSYLGEKRALVPLVTVGLSPSLLYLNTFQTAYGTDFFYASIILGLLYVLQHARGRLSYVLTGMAFGLMMWAAMSYPPSMFLVPLYGFVFWRVLQQKDLGRRQLVSHVQLAGISFIVPLGLMLMYVMHPLQLLYDTSWEGHGIFRGAGVPTFDVATWLARLRLLYRDLFVTGSSGQFELTAVEFSGAYPALGILCVLYGVYRLVQYRSTHRSILLALIGTMSISTTLTTMSSAGMRTNTALLIGFYGLFVIVWIVLKDGKRRLLPSWLMYGLLLIPLHHVLTYPRVLSFAAVPSAVSYGSFFRQQVGDTPDVALERMVQAAQQESVKLYCEDLEGAAVDCRYQEAYAAVLGSCLWNDLSCLLMQGYDPVTDTYEQLDPSLWLSHYWHH